MKRGLLTVLFSVVVGYVLAQTDGDYRTRSSGNWNQTNRWEVFYNGAWRILTVAAAGPYRNVIPSDVSGIITIRATHDLRVSASTTANQLVVEGSAILRVSASRVLTMVDDFAQTPLLVNAGGVVSINGTLDLQSQLTTTPCQINGEIQSNGTVLISNAALLLFNSGSAYQHVHRTGGAIPLATWNLDSHCLIVGMQTKNAAAPANLNQTFGNFTWNTPAMGTTTTFSLNGGLQSVAGNLTFVSTGSPAREIRLDNGGPGYALTIGGDFIIQSGTITLTQAQSTASTLTIGGDFNQSGGTLTLGAGNNAATDVFLNGNFGKTGGIISRGTGAGAGTIRFDGGNQTYSNNAVITSAVGFSVESGSNLNLGTTFLTGTGAFTLNAGGILQVGSLDAGGAIQTGTAGGNIRMSGVRTYQPGSEIIYNGAGEQFMASGHPPAPNTTIDNPGNVFLLSNVTVNGTLNLVNGVFGLESFTLTIGGVYTRSNGILGIISTSSLDIEGSGAFANLFFFNYGNNSMNNFTLNRAGATIVDSHVDLTINGSFTQTAGNLEFSAFGQRSLTLRGPMIQAVGTSIAGGSDGNDIFIISGTGALPATVNLTGTLNTLTMNRTGGTFTAGGTVLVSNLNLTDGTVVPAGLITMATGGTITREFGTTTATPLAQTSYNVVYGGAFNVTTGPEIPANTTSLNNLTLNNTFNVTNPQGSPPFTLTLSTPVFANGSLTITEGTFSTSVANHAVSIKGDLNVATNGIFLPGQSTITFNGGIAQSITGASPLTIFSLAVNQSPASTLTLNSSLDIESELAVTSSSTVSVGTNLLRLLSTPTRTANVGELTGGSIVGSVIVQRYIPKVDAVRNYHYMTSPVTNSNIPDWRVELPSQRVYRWNEPTRAYVVYPLNGALPSGQGFAVDIASTGTFTADIRGTLGQGNISVPVTAASLLAEDGFNLIGNPYPSAIDWDDVPKPAGINNAIYLTDNFNNSGQGSGVQSVTYVDGVATPASYSGQIAQGQAFWVKATANTSLTFVESSKISVTNTQFFREGDVPNVMRVVIEGQGVKDEAVVRLREGATRSFDGKYDAHKFFNSTFKLATLTSDNVKTAINAVGTMDCGAPIPLLVEGAASGTYELSFNGLGSFDGNMSVSLMDLLENKTINITNEERYSFSVSEDNVSSLSTRFQIIFNAIPANALVKVVGEKLCEDGESALVTINESQAGVNYSAEWKGEKLSDVYTGTGSTLQLRINAKNLAGGDNLVSILASSGVCSQVELAEKAVISKISKGDISAVQNGLTCKEGPVTLTAAGAIEGGFYNWYEEEGSIEPIVGQQGAEFVTPSLSKTKTYYVAAANMLGCEGLRVPVMAVVSYMEDVTLTEVTNTTLLSSYENGNQWYINDEVIEGATSNKLEVVEPGIYTVKVSLEGCTSAASREINSEAFEGGINVEPFIKIYPNPTQNKVYLQVKTINETVRATVLNSAGVEIESKGLVGENGIKECEFDLLPYASGIYNLRVFDGTKVFTKKIAKVN